MGARLIRSTALVNALDGRSITEIFGQPDDAKFRSSMTLFAELDGANPIFAEALEKYFRGERDPLTLERLLGAPQRRVAMRPVLG